MKENDKLSLSNLQNNIDEDSFITLTIKKPLIISSLMIKKNESKITSYMKYIDKDWVNLTDEIHCKDVGIILETFNIAE